MTPAKKTDTRPVYSYTRLSTPEQMKGAGLTRQLQMAEAYCTKHGLTLSPRTFRDLGSGYTGANVKTGALGEFITLVEKGTIPRNAILLIERWDRYGRLSPYEQIASIQRLLALGCEVHTLADEKVYSRESLKKNVGDLFYSIALLHRGFEESQTKSERGKHNWRMKRDQAAPGKLHTRMSPGWLAWDGKAWAVDKKKAATVVRVFALTAEGYGRASIANRMNREKIAPPTRRGTSWHASTVGKLLASPSVIGTLQVGHRLATDSGQVRRQIDSEVEGYYPSILSRRLWLATRENTRPRPPSGASHEGQTVNLLVSLAICGRCKASMHYVDKGKDNGVYLVCSAARRGLCKGSRGWRYPELETLLVQLVHRLVKWETLVPRQQTQHRTALVKLEEQLASALVEQEANTLRLKRITDAVEAGAKVAPLLDRMQQLANHEKELALEMERLRGQVESERERVRNLKADVRESQVVFQDWTSGKLKADPAVRHRLAVALRKMLAAVVLTTTKKGYGPSREPRRLELRWRDPQEGPVTFIVPADLTAAYDTEGEEVVRVTYSKAIAP